MTMDAGRDARTEGALAVAVPAELRVAVAIPCYNEAVTVRKVVRDFRAVLPDAAIHVFDNRSDDGTDTLAEEAGAVVHHVRRRGKGHVVQAVFAELDEDVVILVDGDDTYHAEEAPLLLAPVLAGEADMVVGNRLQRADDRSLRRLHQFGNKLIVGAVNRMFGTHYLDILSGYRVFSRRFLDRVTLLTAGFEIETELTLAALNQELEVVELPISYRSRPPDSHSKLRSFRDGYQIMLTAAVLLRDHRPLRVFGGFSLFFLVLAVSAGAMRALAYGGMRTLPESLLVGVVLLFTPLSLIALGIGLTLNGINTRFREVMTVLRNERRR